MKNKITSLLAIVLTIFLAGQAAGQALLKLKPTRMTVQGSSTLHEWESQITKADVKGEFVVNNNQLTDVKNVEVKIPVESIKSTKGKIMDGKTYDAFNSEKNPYIVYSLKSAKINAATSTIDAQGTLTMAGVTKPIELQAKYKVLPNGELQLVLSRKMKMSEWKMTPPTAMMGTIKVGDEITVNFDFVVNTVTKIIQ